MGSIRKRGRTYRAEIYRNGVRASSTHATRQEAADWIVAQEAELLAGRVTPGRQTVREAIEHYLGMRTRGRSDRARLGAIAALPWASTPVGALTPETLASWRDARSKTVRPATVRRDFAALRAVLEVARKELRWISSNPVRDVARPPKPEARRRVISDAERDAMVAALGFDGAQVETIAHETAVVFLLALETAMRAGEILALGPADVDTVRRVATLHRSKTGPGREVPLSPRALELFKVQAGRRLIHIRTRRAGRLFHVDSASLDTTFRRARSEAGLAGFTFHDTRRTALTRLSKVFTPLELARISGHSNLSQLLDYFAPEVDSFALRLV